MSNFAESHMKETPQEACPPAKRLHNQSWISKISHSVLSLFVTYN